MRIHTRRWLDSASPFKYSRTLIKCVITSYRRNNMLENFLFFYNMSLLFVYRHDLITSLRRNFILIRPLANQMIQIIRVLLHRTYPTAFYEKHICIEITKNNCIGVLSWSFNSVLFSVFYNFIRARF